MVSLLATYWASVESCPETYNATASGPWASMIRRKPSATPCNATSSGTRSNAVCPGRRRCAWARRSAVWTVLLDRAAFGAQAAEVGGMRLVAADSRDTAVGHVQDHPATDAAIRADGLELAGGWRLGGGHGPCSDHLGDRHLRRQTRMRRDQGRRQRASARGDPFTPPSNVGRCAGSRAPAPRAPHNP